MILNTTESGLKYKVLVSGTGKRPQNKEIVSVHYTGWLSENGEPGQKFDSSLDRNQPFEFVLGTGYVIKGWDEGVALMEEGSTYRFVIPSNLAYGSHEIPGLIPAHAELIFDVQLLACGDLKKSKHGCHCC